MQPISSRIWTRVAVYISRDDNHYTTGTSFFFLFYNVAIILVLVFISEQRNTNERLTPKKPCQKNNHMIIFIYYASLRISDFLYIFYIKLKKIRLFALNI